MDLLHELMVLEVLVELAQINRVPRRLSITFASLGEIRGKAIRNVAIEFSFAQSVGVCFINLKLTLHAIVVIVSPRILVSIE